MFLGFSCTFMHHGSCLWHLTVLRHIAAAPALPIARLFHLTACLSVRSDGAQAPWRHAAFTCQCDRRPRRGSTDAPRQGRRPLGHGGTAHGLDIWIRQLPCITSEISVRSLRESPCSPLRHIFRRTNPSQEFCLSHLATSPSLTSSASPPECPSLKVSSRSRSASSPRPSACLMSTEPSPPPVFLPRLR